VYVYRDTGDQPGDPAASASAQNERDASYWYDLSGEADAPAKDEAPAAEATRGPFEPLVSSSDLPAGSTQPSPSTSDVAPPVQPPGSGGKHAVSDTVSSDGQQDSALAQARRLEQIKDFYLTAEAIGERNVDKHFDQLMAQQRALISEYFKQSSAVKPPDTPAAQADPAAQEDPPSSASVVAEHPRAW
jgi:hypothetical protein